MIRLIGLMLPILMVCNLFAQQQDIVKSKSTNSIWVGTFAGASLLTEKAPDSLQVEFKDYLNNLRSGSHYGFQAEYFINSYVGLGAKYTRFTTKLDADSIIVKLFANTYYVNISNNMHIHSITPMIYGKLPLLKNKLSIVGSTGPAWLFYRNIYESIDDSASFKGSSPGYSASIRLTYEVIKNLHLGLQGNYLHAFLKGYTKDNGTEVEEESFEKEDYKNLSRWDLSFGIYYVIRRKNEY
jgi:hypothetical protein